MEGLSLDNVALNVIAYLYYTLFNVAFCYVPFIQVSYCTCTNSTLSEPPHSFFSPFFSSFFFLILLLPRSSSSLSVSAHLFFYFFFFLEFFLFLFSDGYISFCLRLFCFDFHPFFIAHPLMFLLAAQCISSSSGSSRIVNPLVLLARLSSLSIFPLIRSIC